VIERCAEAVRFLDANLQENIQELDHFRQFVGAQSLYSKTKPDGARTNRLGFQVSDMTYWEENKSLLAAPAALTDPKFLGLLASPETVPAAAAMIREEHPDWTVFAYRSQFILSADSTTYGRLLVLVPDEAQPDGSSADKWIQFAVPTEEDRGKPKPRSVSMVVVRRRPQGSEVRLMDFMRSRDGRLSPNVNLVDSPSNGCYDCHKVGVIPIFPKSSVAPEGLNERIASYGRCDFGELSVPSYGPGLGVASPSADPVGKAMNCGACHDRLGSINYLAAVRSSRDIGAFESKKGLVQSFIEQGIMPPGNTLTLDQRRELYRRVSDAYLDLDRGTGALVDWLRSQ
jgi:hypothetical protein